MIFDAILTLFANLLNVFLAPLEIINIGIDIVSSIPVVASFLQVIAYLMPWNNLIPLFVIVGSVMSFRIVIATITAVWNILPFVR